MSQHPTPRVLPGLTPETDPIIEDGTTRPSGATDESNREGAVAIHRGVGLAVAWVVAVALAGYLTVRVDVRWGLVTNVLLLAIATIGAMAATYRGYADGASVPHRNLSRQANWCVAIALVPLVRVVSLAMPLDAVTPPNRYGLIAGPVVVAAALAVRANGYRRCDVGLTVPRSWWRMLLTGVVAVGGVGLGYIEYRTGSTEPLVSWPIPPIQIVVTVMLLFLAGFAEEIVFRGLIQRATSDLMGQLVGALFGAALFASVGVGRDTWPEVGLAFAVSLVFAGAVVATRSLVGVVLARWTASVCLLILFPHIL
jgi:membrane protease YdiL (CAAX protease family)